MSMDDREHADLANSIRDNIKKMWPAFSGDMGRLRTVITTQIAKHRNVEPGSFPVLPPGHDVTFTHPVVKWRGIAKLTEECGELLQILGKLMAYPEKDHPDGSGSLKERLQYELADVQAAITYFIAANNLNGEFILARAEGKTDQFLRWRMAGVIPEQPVGPPENLCAINATLEPGIIRDKEKPK